MAAHDPESLLQLFETLTDDSAKVYLNVDISRAYSDNDLKLSIKYADEALKIAKKTRNPDIIAFAVFNAGNAYFFQGIYDKAIQFYYDYLNIMREKDSKRGIAFARSNLAAVKLSMKSYQEAKIDLIETLKLLDEADPNKTDTLVQQQMPHLLNNMGIIHQNLGNADSALHYYQLGIELAKKAKSDDYVFGNLYNNIGSLQLSEKNYDLAREPIQQALRIRQKDNNLAGQASSHDFLAKYYQETGQNDSAMFHFLKAYNLAKVVASTELKTRISENLYIYFKKQNNLDSALKYHELYKSHDDSLNRENTVKEITRMELTTSFQEKENLQRLEQKKRELRYIIMGVVLVLSLVIFILLFMLSQNRLRRMRLAKANEELFSRNYELEKQNLEKELEIKNKELTTNVMYLIRKNELIKQIAEELTANSQAFKKENQELIRRIVRDLDKAQQSDIWDEFEIRFQQVHNAFYEKLMQINPELSLNERRLCAFLRLNMTTKEIASITGQSVRSIEVARTRLRKKLNLTNSDTSLSDFLSRID
ncbi:MAG TPA: tetratricopeptide repeat protein [Bacteroidales bacterium]|nr:tetratricopeptide repeat protein [Bacteroidales bacterium]